MAGLDIPDHELDGVAGRVGTDLRSEEATIRAERHVMLLRLALIGQPIQLPHLCAGRGAPERDMRAVGDILDLDRNQATIGAEDAAKYVGRYLTSRRGREEPDLRL